VRNELFSKSNTQTKTNRRVFISNNDYSTIKWDVLEGKAPTQSEIDDAIEQVKADELAEAEAKAQAKATAEGKLAALGLTTDDLRALGL
jgi:hypothetical protein